MSKATQKHVTDNEIQRVRELLKRISMVRGAPIQLKFLLRGYVDKIDESMSKGKATNKLKNIEILINIVTKLIQLMQFFGENN